MTVTGRHGRRRRSGPAGQLARVSSRQPAGVRHRCRRVGGPTAGRLRRAERPRPGRPGGARSPPAAPAASRGRHVDAGLAVDDRVDLTGRARAHHRPPHRHRLEDRRDPGLEVGLLQRHDDERGVGVQLAEVEEVEPADRHVRRDVEAGGGVGALGPRAGGGDDDVDVQARARRRRASGSPAAPGRRRRSSAGPVIAVAARAGCQNAVSTMNGMSTTCSGR